MRIQRKKKETPLSHSLEGISLEQMCREKLHHIGNGHFENPWNPLDPRTLRDVIRWKMERNTSYRRLPKEGPPPVYPVDLERIFKGSLTVTYIGHATLLIQIDGIVLITDPVFSDLSVYLRRKIHLPLAKRTLKGMVQGILISHNHYDHFSLKARRYLRNKTFIVPVGFKRYFRSKKFPYPICLDWFDSFIFKGLRITFLPTQHWSRRTLRDTNRTLWGGFLIEGSSGSVYFGGDSGYFHGFRELGQRFHIDIAILPIGAFAPRWLMKTVHLSPYEAVKAAIDLKAETMIPCHWGTYQISEEPLLLPIRLLKRIKQNLAPPLEIVPLMPGETYEFKEHTDP